MQLPKWIRGVLPDEGRVRLSARTANWAEAEDKAKTMEQRSRGGYDRATSRRRERSVPISTSKRRGAFPQRHNTVLAILFLYLVHREIAHGPEHAESQHNSGVASADGLQQKR